MKAVINYVKRKTKFDLKILQIHFRNPLILFRKTVTGRCCNRINEMQSESYTGMIPGI